jgi:hypothetical protein
MQLIMFKRGKERGIISDKLLQTKVFEILIWNIDKWMIESLTKTDLRLRGKSLLIVSCFICSVILKFSSIKFSP